MKKQMKIMIAYDGSSSADAAIDDLIVAGLPLEAEALIVTVANVLETAIPEQSDFNALKKLVTRTLFVKTVASVEKETQRIWTEAKDLASGCRRRVQSYFPDWQVCEQTALGDPAKELLAIAENWKPDLIVVGSHGRTALGRFFLGSVSAKLSSEAKCSVRVGRRSNRVLFG